MNPRSSTLREIEQAGLARAVDVGAYVKLLIHYSRHGTLPTDGDKLAAIACIDSALWPSVESSLRTLFSRDGDVLHPIAMRQPEKRVGPSRQTLEKVMGLWREILPELPEPMVISDDRLRQFTERWEESSKIRTSVCPNGFASEDDGLKWWAGLFQHIRRSDFMMGRSTDFKAHFDMVIQKSTFRKLLEGVYHVRNKR